MAKDLVEQTHNALHFVQKLYLETFYLIKEIEGLLTEEDFRILKPNAYRVSAKTSTSLETWGVEEWLPKTLTVCFCKKEFIEGKSKTTTKFKPDLKLIVLHIGIFDKEFNQPRLLIGVIKNITNEDKKVTKFENYMWEFAYNWRKIFSNIPNIDYSHTQFTFKGKTIKRNLLDLNTSVDLKDKVINPVIKLYEEI